MKTSRKPERKALPELVERAAKPVKSRELAVGKAARKPSCKGALADGRAPPLPCLRCGSENHRSTNAQGRKAILHQFAVRYAGLQ